MFPRSRKGSGQIESVVDFTVDVFAVDVVVVVVDVDEVVAAVVAVDVDEVVVVVVVVEVVVDDVVVEDVVDDDVVEVVVDVFDFVVEDRNSSSKLKRSSKKGRSWVDPVINVVDVDSDDVVDSVVVVELKS